MADQGQGFDPDQFLQSYQPPGQGKAKAGAGASGGFDPDEFLRQYQGPQTAAPSATAEAQAPTVPQTSGWQRVGQMGWNALTRGAGEGLAALTEPLQRWDSSLAQKMPRVAAKLPTGPGGADSSWEQRASGVAVNPAANQPQNTFEKYATAGVEGAGAALPTALAGGGVATPLLLGAASGMAGEGARQEFPDLPWAPAAAGLAVGGLGAVGQALNDASQLSKVASGLGSAKTLQQAGEALQPAAQKWLDTKLPAMEDEVWSPVDAALKGPAQPNGPPVPLANYSAALADITQRGGVLAGSSRMLRPQLPDRLNADLASLPATPTWDDVRQLRSDLGAASSNPKIAADIGAKNIDRLYAAITTDLSGVAQANGAGDLFAAANARSSELRTLADQHVRPLVDKGIAPGDAAKLALSGSQNGGSRLAALRLALPDEVDELAAAAVRTHPQLWNKMSPEARDQLVRDPMDKIKVENAVRDVTGHGELGKLGEELVGASTGEMLGALGHSLGGMSEITGGAAGGLIGLGLPPALRAGAALATRPQLLQPLAAGQLGATGKLTPPLSLGQ